MSSRRWYSVLFVSLLVLSFLVKIPGIEAPFAGFHAGRQSHAAITVWTFMEEGPSILKYQTPILGPPWRITLDFPVFQLSAYAIAKTGLFTIEGSCRLAHILYFYVSLFFLFLLGRRLLNSQAAACIVLVYAWLPYTLFWSRTSMIDYVAVSFALAYMYFYLQWLLAKRPSFVMAGLALVSGTFAYLIKVTTMPSVVFVLAIFVLRAFFMQLRRIRDENAPWRTLITTQKLKLLTWVVMTFVPVQLCMTWLHYGDGAKEASPATSWYTAVNMVSWNFFRLDQILAVGFWKKVFIDHGFQVVFNPLALLVLFGLGLYATFRFESAEGRIFLSAAICGAFVPMVVHANLYYVHPYYAMAISPYFAMTIGTGLWYLQRRFPRQQNALNVLLLGVGATYFLSSSNLWLIEMRKVYPGARAVYEELKSFADEAAAPNAPIVVADNGWSPELAFHLRRKAYYLLPGRTAGVFRDSPSLEDYEIFFSRKPHPEVLALFDHVYLGDLHGWRIYALNEAGRRADKQQKGMLIPSRQEWHRRTEEEGRLLMSVRGMQDLDWLSFGEGLRVVVREGATPRETFDQPIVLEAQTRDPIIYINVQIQAKVPGEQYILHAVYGSPGFNSAQVYYMTLENPSYSPEQSVLSHVAQGENDVYLSFPKASNESVTGRIRFDPANLPGKYILQRLEVFEAGQAGQALLPDER